jgi:predicted ATPase/class 3 adenylate cyclase
MTERPRPTGTIAFLFTDIEGSTRSWQAHGALMGAAVARHDELLRAAIETHDGHVFKTVGDAFCAVFETTAQALAAAVEAQRALAGESWVGIEAIRARMAIHVGVAEERESDYFGPAVNRVARLLSAGYGGQVLLSLPASELAHESLPPGIALRDLGEHRLKDLDRAEHVFQLIVPELPNEFAPLKTVDARPNNLPLELTPFIGRTVEIEKVKTLLLKPEVRLLTLTGPGGIGKSRLALQAVADLIDEFHDGAFFIPLAPITDPDLVVQAIAEGLSIREIAGQLLINAVRDHLRPLNLVLLLDNFEQVLDAAKLLPPLLRECPKLKIVVTSRSVLRVTGEHEIAVPTLALPFAGRNGAMTADTAMSSDAVRLFVSRARSVKADFDATDENARAIVEICQRLDGLPLAIELAAARIRMLTPQAMLPRLLSRLKLLTGGGRDLPERQQTLRGAIAWSFDLLPSEQQTLLARMSVFSRGATFESAEAVCSGVELMDVAGAPELGDLELPEVDIFDGIESLVGHSLLRQDEDGDAVRYAMLETIREFGLEKLESLGESEPVRNRHALHFMSIAEQASEDLNGAKQTDALRQIDAEIDNLRNALGWSNERGLTELALRLGRSLDGYWRSRGLLSEGRNWLERVLALGDAGDGTLRAKVLNNLGNLANDLGDYRLAQSSYEESLAVWRARNDRRAVAVVLSNLGQVAATLGDYDSARELQAESLAIEQELGDKHGISFSLHNLGVVAHHGGDLDAARRYHEEALAIRKSIGDSGATAYSTCALAHVIHDQGDDEKAGSLFRDGIDHFRRSGDRVGLAFALSGFAESSGDDLSAGEHFVEALTLYQEIGPQQSASCLEEVAALAADRGHTERAIRLIAAAAAVRDQIGEPTPPVLRSERQAVVDRLRADVGDESFAALWNEGSLLDASAAIKEAIAEASQH